MNTQTKPKMMIVGTFHMRYTPDLQRMEFGDLFAEQKKKEILKVVEALKRFNPTKVAFEVVKGEENELNHDYMQYVKGELDLKIDEIHQLGFRIAKDLNHKKIFAVDWMETVGNRGIGEVFEWAKMEQPDLYQYINDKYRSQHKESIGNESIYEVIKELNQVEFISNQHEMYMTLARIGKGDEYVGIDWVRWWYQRNLIIYNNLANLTNSPSDRTLFIVGAAHVHLVSQFLRESSMFEVVRATEYLT